MNIEFIKRILSSIVLVPIVFFLIVKGSIIFNFFVLVCFLITLYEWRIMSKNKPYYIFGIFFLLISFFSIFKLRNDFSGDYEYLILITIICISTDIGGYIFGKLFKGPKLIKISPNKTYSGMVGSYIFSLICINFFINNQFSNYSTNNTAKFFLFVLLVSTVSQVGDIIISYFKRQSNIKDTGKIIPGHGGILDRIDGMIFAFPFSYIILINNFF
jgi:phosphatidate cytidylyltransferase